MKTNLLVPLIAFTCLALAPEGHAQDSKLSFSLSMGEGYLDEPDIDEDYANIGVRYAQSAGPAAEWGGFYEIATDDLEIDLLCGFYRNYLQPEGTRAFIEFDFGLAMGDEDTELAFGGMLGVTHDLNEQNSLDLGFRYIFTEDDYTAYNLSSLVLSYSMSM